MPDSVSQLNNVFQPYARSPLHSFGLAQQAQKQDESCGVWMNELPLLGYILVRGDAQDPAFTQAVQQVLGVALPANQGAQRNFSQGLAIWQGPDEWLLITSKQSHAQYLSELSTVLHPCYAQVVDNSGGLTTVYLSGTHHVDLLCHVGVYDFESIAAGQVVSTVCQKANIVVLRHDEHGLFVVFRRSFADYLWLLLTKAARPYQLGISTLTATATHPVLSLL